MHKLLAGLALAVAPLLAAAQQQPTRPYWQQEVNYSIDVALDDQQHMLTGREEMQYHNNSPDALPFIWMHLWPNAYRDNSSAFARQQRQQNKRKFEFAPAADRGYIDQLAFQVNGQPATLEFDPNNPDIAKLVLPQPLAPGGRITISTPFRVKLPASFSRMGHVGQSYQVSQWYPKPAVYDQTGWHPIPYLDQGEFYSEYGAFDVRITLPDNYVVGATGELQNPDERQRLDQLAQATARKTTAEEFGKDVSFPASAGQTKTLRYVQDRVHDFAWFADKRFNVLKDTVLIPGNPRPVTTWLLFTNRNADGWLKHRDDIKKALLGYSQFVGPYPYSVATAVDGALSAGSGMEYPTVTVTEPAAIIHEVGHNWFYGILGSNERAQPWQDEGVNTYVENRVKRLDDSLSTSLFSLKNIPAAKLGLENLPPDALEQLVWQIAASRGLDQPAGNTPAGTYTNANYGFMVYQKTAALLRYLAAYLGQEQFDRGMHQYFDQWKFRHPAPADMQAAFERASGQQLDWFFGPMLSTTTRYNASISDILETDEQIKVLVRNESVPPFAVPVAVVDEQGKVLELQWTPVFGGDPEAETDETTQLDFRRVPGAVAVVVDPYYITPILNRRDNRRRIHGFPSTFEHPHVQPLIGVQRWDRAGIYYLPVIGANTYDKFMLGAAFYSDPLVPKKVSYVAMPMYSFNRNSLKGIGQISLNSLPNGRVLQRVTTSLLAARFERYTKLEPSITLEFRRKQPNGPVQHLQLAYTNIDQRPGYKLNGEKLDQSYYVPTLHYTVTGGNAVNKFSADIELNALVADSIGVNSEATQLLRMAGTYERYYSAKHSVRLRLFGGRFLNQGVNSPFYMGLSGSPDYRRQTAFLDRQQISDTWTAQRHQTDDRDGAFKSFVPVASRRWLTTLNIEADVPKLPFMLFADLGATASKYDLGDGRTQRLFYDAGLATSYFNGVFRLYLPVAGSGYTDGLPSGFRDFAHNIRFVLDLQKANPLRLLDQALH